MLSNAELRARIDILAADSIGSENSGVSSDRAEAMDRYHGRLYGDELEGRSKVVSRDLAEATDWIMPSVMRPFFTCGNLADFDPIGPEDVELAEQESDYTNHVILVENPGFMILHDVFKDALVLRNGYAKAWCDYSYKTSAETFSGLTADEVTALFSKYQSEGAEVEVLEQEQESVTLILEGQAIEVPVWELRLRVTRKEKRICIEAVPPEEMRISKRCRGDLNSADYVEHRTKKTRTTLIEMGMPRDFVDGLPSYANQLNQDSTARDMDGESDAVDGIDRSMDEIEYRECYVRVDCDEDGKAELRKVVIVGKQIPPGEDWNHEIDEQPFSYAVPKRLPHRHLGESLYDDLGEIPLVKTILTRSTLDNTYGLINAEWLVNERVNLDDFLETRPLGVKRVLGKDPIGDAASPVQKPNILNQALPLLGYVDQIKENRTGVRPAVTGLDPDALKEVRSTAYTQNLNQANAKVEFIARMFAETFVRDLVLKVHNLVIKHQNKPKMVRLRNKFIPIDPSLWRDRSDVRINVGLGTGTRAETKEAMTNIAQWQQQLASLGMVGPKQAYNSFVRFCKALGETNPEAYAINPDPNNPEYQAMQQQMQQQQAQNPLAEVEKIKAQANMQIAQMKAALENQKHQMALQKQQFEAMEAQLRLQLEQRQQAFKEITDQTKQKADLAIMAEKARSEQDLVEFKEALAKKALEAEVATLEAERERIKAEVLAAQDQFRQQEMARLETASSNLDAKIASLHNSILQELAATVSTLSRPRRTKILATDADGMPIESVSVLE